MNFRKHTVKFGTILAGVAVSGVLLNSHFNTSSEGQMLWKQIDGSPAATSRDGQQTVEVFRLSGYPNNPGTLHLTLRGGSCPSSPESNRQAELTITTNGVEKKHVFSVPRDKSRELVLGDRITDPGNTRLFLTEVNELRDEYCGPIVIDKTEIRDDTATTATMHMNPYLNAEPAWNQKYLNKVKETTEAHSSDPRAKQLHRLNQPSSVWLGDWTPPEEAAKIVKENITYGLITGRTPTFVIYGIPGVDCRKTYPTGYTEQEYYPWLQSITEAVGAANPVFIYEPDALPTLGTCKSPEGDRLNIMKRGVDILSKSNATIYLDAGHSQWHPADVMADRLRKIGVDKTRGFSLNVSNTHWTDEQREYGEKLSELLGGKNFVIDTSRNGNGPYTGDNEAWCNPPGRKLGDPPTSTNEGHLDAKLWVKPPGESDETCRGGPKAGVFWDEYALDIAARL